MEWQQHRELTSLPDNASDFDAAMMLFHNAAGQRKAEAGAVSFGRIKRTEDVGEMQRGDSTAGVADYDAGKAILCLWIDLDIHCASSRHRLHCVK